MSVFADTNWLESIYFKPARDAAGEVQSRHHIVEQRMRKMTSPLIISHIVLLEARNVFSRLAGVAKPKEWDKLQSDFNARIFVDPMNWDLLRRETNLIFERFSHRTVIGTFDATLVASARLAGAREFLSFDERLKTIAACLEMKVFPPLTSTGKALLAALKR